MCFSQLAALLDHSLILLLTGSLTWILDLRIRRKTFKIGITRYGEVIDCTFNTTLWNTSVRDTLGYNVSVKSFMMRYDRNEMMGCGMNLRGASKSPLSHTPNNCMSFSAIEFLVSKHALFTRQRVENVHRNEIANQSHCMNL